MREGNRKQALVPEGAAGARAGRARRPASSCPRATARAACSCCPGPPRELQPMWADGARDRARCAPLLGRARAARAADPADVRVPESEIARHAARAGGAGVALDGSRSRPACAAASSRSPRCSSRTRRRDYDAFEAALRERHGDALFSDDGATIDEIVARLLARAAAVADAESCTGGLMAGRLTDRAGSSAYVLGGLVVYSNEAKVALAGVPAELIERARRGVARGRGRAGRRRARALRRRHRASASPASPGRRRQPDKPVGTVCLCVAGAGGERIERTVQPAGRPRRRARAHDDGRACTCCGGCSAADATRRVDARAVRRARPARREASRRARALPRRGRRGGVARRCPPDVAARHARVPRARGRRPDVDAAVARRRAASRARRRAPVARSRSPARCCCRRGARASPRRSTLGDRWPPRRRARRARRRGPARARPLRRRPRRLRARAAPFRAARDRRAAAPARARAARRSAPSSSRWRSAPPAVTLYRSHAAAATALRYEPLANASLAAAVSRCTPAAMVARRGPAGPVFARCSRSPPRCSALARRAAHALSWRPLRRGFARRRMHDRHASRSTAAGAARRDGRRCASRRIGTPGRADARCTSPAARAGPGVSEMLGVMCRCPQLADRFRVDRLRPARHRPLGPAALPGARARPGLRSTAGGRACARRLGARAQLLHDAPTPSRTWRRSAALGVEQADAVRDLLRDRARARVRARPSGRTSSA